MALFEIVARLESASWIFIAYFFFHSWFKSWKKGNLAVDRVNPKHLGHEVMRDKGLTAISYDGRWISERSGSN